MAVLSKADIAALSPEERLELIDDLWESLESPLPDSRVEDAHKRTLEKRLADYDPSSEELLTLDEVAERLRDR